jgi:FtsZ-binding cell division protein ZapB
VSNGLEKFTDLENKVYRVIELFRAVKLQKESLEKDVLRIKSQLDQIIEENDRLKTEILEYKREKDLVKDRLEAILQNLDSLADS